MRSSTGTICHCQREGGATWGPIPLKGLVGALRHSSCIKHDERARANAPNEALPLQFASVYWEHYR